MNIGNSVVLNTMGVPIIHSFDNLCEHLSISAHLLYYLVYKKDYCYHEKTIPKKDKSVRVLNVPNLPMKVVQRWILKEILEKINVSSQSMAFFPGKNGIRENAERHKKNIYILEMDITGFFDAITEQKVYQLFRIIGYNREVSGILANLCTFNDYLPQGAVTSPYIANLVCYHMDSRINGYCSRKEIVYTRYADDLAFSSNNRTLLNRSEKFIKYILDDEGFLVNEKKTRYYSNDVKKTITGITINDESIHVDKQFKRILRAQIFNSIANHDYKCNSQIVGKIAFADSIEDGFHDKMIKYITSIIVRPELSCDRDIVDSYNRNKLFKELPDMVFKNTSNSLP